MLEYVLENVRISQEDYDNYILPQIQLSSLRHSSQHRYIYNRNELQSTLSFEQFNANNVAL